MFVSAVRFLPHEWAKIVKEGFAVMMHVISARPKVEEGIVLHSVLLQSINLNRLN